MKRSPPVLGSPAGSPNAADVLDPLTRFTRGSEAQYGKPVSAFATICRIDRTVAVSASIVDRLGHPAVLENRRGSCTTYPRRHGAASTPPSWTFQFGGASAGTH